MTPEQALQILANCAAQAHVPDAVHAEWKRAYQVLQAKLAKDQPA